MPNTFFQGAKNILGGSPPLRPPGYEPAPTHGETSQGLCKPGIQTERHG